MFKNLVIDPERYELAFQEAEPVFAYEEGVFGDDRRQELDPNTGFPMWTVRVTASDAMNREEQTLEVRLTARERPSAEFRETVLMPNLRVQVYSRKAERNVTAMWAADAFTTVAGAAKSSKPTAAKAA